MHGIEGVWQSRMQSSRPVIASTHVAQSPDPHLYSVEFAKVKLAIHPPVEPPRLACILEAAAPMTVTNAASPAEALAAMPDADAFFGKLTPEFLAAARQ